MVTPVELAGELRTRIDSHFEWLLVRASGATFPLRRNEIDVSADDGEVLLTALDDSGIGVSRVLSLITQPDQVEFSVEVAHPSGVSDEIIRLVPRTPAIQLSRNIEFARLERTNSIAASLIRSFPTFKLTRLALSMDNGRLGQIFFRDKCRDEFAVLCEVTASMTHEAIMTSAMSWFEKLQHRKQPVREVWIATERKQARSLRKLLALLNKNQSARFRLFEVSGDAENLKTKELQVPMVSALWREKPRQIKLPSQMMPSELAERIASLAPDKTDVIFSKQGETIRFHGLPFARVRTVAGEQRAWFGIDRNRRQLDDRSLVEFEALVAELESYRRFDTDNKRHELYRMAPEAWLESILRRNIRQLDANLILSQIYNQFRASSDKIDLLAIRRDGRLIIIELKTSPDRETVFQAADYWRKIELQRQRGELARIRAFGDMEILDKPALVYVVAPALSFHRDFGFYAQSLRRDIEVWRFELREDWRSEIKVLMRRGYQGSRL